MSDSSLYDNTVYTKVVSSSSNKYDYLKKIAAKSYTSSNSNKTTTQEYMPGIWVSVNSASSYLPGFMDATSSSSSSSMPGIMTSASSGSSAYMPGILT